jgi:hypothetical protein
VRTIHESPSCRLFLMPGTCSSLLSDHGSASPDLSTIHRLERRGVESTGLLCVWSISRLDGSTNRKMSVSESRSLTLGPTDEQGLAQFIMKVAFSDPSSATNPVLQGVFALASLHLHGGLKSFRYKHLILASLKQSVDWLDEKTLLQNLIATMLLYHYEVTISLLHRLGENQLTIIAGTRARL